MKKVCLICLAGLCGLLISLSARAETILYLPVEGRDTAHARLFQDVFVDLGDKLHKQGFRIFEDPDVTSALTRNQAMDKLNELKGGRITTVLMLGLDHRKQIHGPRQHERLVATSRLYDVASGVMLDKFQTKSPSAVLQRKECHKPCRDMVIKRHLDTLMPQLEARVAKALGKVQRQFVESPVITQSGAIELTLKGFKEIEIFHIEERLFDLDSTYDLSTLKGGATPTFKLERQKGVGTPRQDLSGILADLDLQARITQSRDQITLIKVPDNLAYAD